MANVTGHGNELGQPQNNSDISTAGHHKASEEDRMIEKEKNKTEGHPPNINPGQMDSLSYRKKLILGHLEVQEKLKMTIRKQTPG